MASIRKVYREGFCVAPRSRKELRNIADVFARHLLAPLSLAKGMEAPVVAEIFGVSRGVANIIAGEKSSCIISANKDRPIAQTAPHAPSAPILPGLEAWC